MDTDIVRLNLGCGHKILDGYINVDKAGNWSGHKPDVDCDIRKLSFEDNYADEIMAIHVLEHFFFWEVEDILKEWKRVLKPGGKLILEMPDLAKIVQHLITPGSTMTKTWYALYGDPNYKDADMCHKWCYTGSMLKWLLESYGYKDIKEEEPLFHFKNRDFRMTAIK